MQLRIFRRFDWQIDCPISEVRMGGRNPMKLVSYDELQYAENYGSVNVVWKAVQIVEDEKPEHPAEKREREKFEKMSAESSRIFEQLRSEGKLPPTFDKLVGNNK